MILHMEKKYRVEDFTQISKNLAVLGTTANASIATTHYYADTGGTDVVKIVDHSHKTEIHYLDENEGLFTLGKAIPIASKEEGFAFLGQQGIKNFQTVAMFNTDYAYQEGIIGLYKINDNISSVILDFPDDSHHHVEKLLGLTHAEHITVPYDLYIAMQKPNEA